MKKKLKFQLTENAENLLSQEELSMIQGGAGGYPLDLTGAAFGDPAKEVWSFGGAGGLSGAGGAYIPSDTTTTNTQTGNRGAYINVVYPVVTISTTSAPDYTGTTYIP